MNKMGHLSFGIALGSVYVAFGVPQPRDLQDGVVMALTIAGTALGCLAPDLDHRSSTASRWISPFPARWRRRLRMAGSFLLFAAAVLLSWGMLARAGYASPPPASLLKSVPLLAGAGIIGWVLARLREMVLIFVGALLLAAWAIYGLHWFVPFGGVTFMILPALKHRGLIHTPEFAAPLTIGAFSLVSGSNDAVKGLATGLVIGWWSHLAGDAFGREGIRSLLLPKVRVAFRLFKNGGAGEKLLSSASWAVAGIALVWGWQ